MELYKTSHFREIKKVKCEKVENGKVYFKLCDYNPQFESERIITKPTNGSQINYHKTKQDAKNFILMQLSDKIMQMELDLEKYKSLVPNFR